MKKKIAIINQRYGKEVNGGSEYYTYLLANHLKKNYDISVLTSTALDYVSWENYYKEGKEIIDGIEVYRFRVRRKRSKYLFGFLLKILPKRIPFISSFFEKFWIDSQGPYCPDFIKYMEDNKTKYDIFIFVTYLYYLTARGIEKVSDKSILVPTAHNEPYIKFDLYQSIFNSPKAIVFLTEEEKKFVLGFFKNQYIYNDVINIGIDLPHKLNSNLFKEKYNIDYEYFIYVGRVDEGKKCGEMFDYFIKYKKNNNSRIKLLLLGKLMMDMSERDDIISLGFVSEEDKYNGIAGATAMIMPSQYESLSISVLESMTIGVPVVVNGESEVLKMHVKQSEAGMIYKNFLEFENSIKIMEEKNEIYHFMRENGKKYIKENYNWNTVLKKWDAVIEKI